jgi:hypothetical protein
MFPPQPQPDPDALSGPPDPSRPPSKAALRHESMLINEVSLVLSQKRTSLSVMRTGLAVLALPLSVLSLLIVISRYYDPMEVMYLLGPLLAICGLLAVLGSILIVRAFRRINQLNRVLAGLKTRNAGLRGLCLDMDDLVSADRDF